MKGLLSDGNGTTPPGRWKMTYRIGTKTFEVKQTGNKFFYWSPRAFRWLPVAKAKVEGL